MATMRDIGLNKAVFAAEDLSDKLYYAAKLDTNGLAALAGAADVFYGIITESGATGKPVTLQYGGEVKAIAGGSFNAGVLLEVGAGGKLIAGSTKPIAKSNEAGALDRIVSVNLHD